MPDQKMLEQVRDMVNKMDMKSGLVVPFYVTVETHGTDGQVFKVEDRVKEDIVVALGLSRSLVTGDGPDFATASINVVQPSSGGSQKLIIDSRSPFEVVDDLPPPPAEKCSVINSVECCRKDLYGNLAGIIWPRG